MKTSGRKDTPLYGSIGVDTYLRLIRSRYSYINVSELLRHAKMESYQVEDDGHLFTQEQINLFHEKLEQLTGNKEIAREAGQYAASPDALGFFRKYMLGLVGPANAYELVGKYAGKISRSSAYEAKKTGRNSVEITVTPHEGVQEEPFQCKNRLGYWDAISMGFKYKLPKIEHPECLFKGDKVCRYIVSWQESRSDFFRRSRNYVAFFLAAACLGSVQYTSLQNMLTVFLPFSVCAVLLLSWYAGVSEIKELRSAVTNLKGSSDEALEQTRMNYKNILVINEIGQALSKESDIDGILANVIDVLQRRLDYDRGLILLANSEKTRLCFRAGFGYTEEQSRNLLETTFHLDKPDSKGLFVVSFREQRPFLLNDINEIKDDLSSRSLEFAKKMGVKSFICCPIIYENESLGILAVDNIKTKKPLIQRDINLLMGVAPQIGISIHNVGLVETKLRQFQSVLQVLVATTDARDPVTAGHSVKVTSYAVGICRELGLPNDYCEMIRVAALLHDYGKVGVADSILKKPGRLTPDEYLEVKKHAERTTEILEQIHFEGIYKEVPKIAGAHHEKLDGTGYPKGLKGEQIPLGAKIIAVADVFESITSKRHYRDPMPLNAAFAILRMGIGIHFDKVCVEALIRYVKAKKLISLVSEKNDLDCGMNFNRGGMDKDNLAFL